MINLNKKIFYFYDTKMAPCYRKQGKPSFKLDLLKRKRKKTKFKNPKFMIIYEHLYAK